MIKTTHPVYIDENNSVPANPFRLTPYVKDNGEIWLAAAGNGCADDVMLVDLGGKTEAEIWREYYNFDLAAMRKDAEEIAAAGDSESAEWLQDWCNTIQGVVEGTRVDDDELDNVLREIDGIVGDAILGDIKAAGVYRIAIVGNYTLYRADPYGPEVYFVLGDGEPTMHDNADDAWNQLFL